MLRKLFKLLFALVILLAVAIFVVGYFADDIAKAAIEKGGTEALGVTTTVEKCHIGFFTGKFSMNDLAIANPKSFGDGNFLQLGEGAIEISALSLLSDKIEVPELLLSGTRLNLIQGAGGSNYGTILDNLEKFQGPSEPSNEEGKRFIVKRLLIEDVVVTVLPVQQLGIGSVTVPIEKIELNDIGSESDKGVLLSDLAGIVVEAILKHATATGRLPDMIKATLDGKLAQVHGLKDAGIEKLEGLLDGAKLPGGVKVPDDAKKAIDGAKDALGKGLKGLGIGR
jgi:uncharacterized protein involved in outer membrane biogenesis